MALRFLADRPSEGENFSTGLYRARDLKNGTFETEM